jgi:nitrite reductase/ring-hydroxylating ferredoxin subunit
MKYFKTILLIFLFLINCESDDQNTILPKVPVNVTVNLTLPQFNKLLTPGNWAYVDGGIKGIIIYNVNNNTYRAYERSCPHLPPSDCTRMNVEQSFKMKCPCDSSEFSILDGTPITPNINSRALEYRITIINTSTLKITNF